MVFTRIYALLVCFFTMLCMTISTGLGLYNLVKITFPETMIEPYRYEVFQAPFYPVASVDGTTAVRKGPGGSATEMSPEELEALRERQREQAVEMERKRSIASLVRVLIAVLVSAPVFFIHWRISQKLERSAGTSTDV